MFLPIAAAAQPQINAAVSAVVQELTPAVQHIDYKIARDWDGQWAIFFRVLLSDEASHRDRLQDVATQVVWRISDRIDIPGLGLFPHFDFESQSEWAKRNELARV